MSVAAMTMDDQRPLMNSFETMKNKYDNLTNAGGNIPTVSASGSSSVAPPSGPASPTPSASEEQQHHHHHHHHSASSSHHHHHHQQQQQHHINQQHQLQQQTTLQQQQLAHQQLNYDAQAAAAAVVVAEQRQRLLEEQIESLKVEQTRLSQQCVDAQRREKILMRRLANKEQEFQDYVSQIAEYKAAQAPGAAALRSALLDPAVNLLFEKLKKELKATKAKLEETQNELSAWKFTPDSNTGKRLMAKCRLLYQENEELGKMTSNGRLAKLETELAMQKSFSEEVKKSQSELDDFLQELDEDVEGMQSTILFLQQELKTTRDRIQILEKENYQLKNGSVAGSNENTTDVDAVASLNGSNNINVTNSTAAIINNIINSQIMPSVNANANKFQTLETIEENVCLRTSIQNNVSLPPIAATTNEFYNGIQEHVLVNPYVTSTMAVVAAAAGEEGNSSNSSSNNSVCNKLRTPASRKRNYDSDSNENATATTTAIAVAVPVAAAPVQQVVVVATPRTLPPKKSKLRVTPVRRASMQSIDMNENDNAVPLLNALSSSSSSGVMVDAVAVSALSVVGQSPFVDNAVAGMANEEGSLLMAVDDDNTNGIGVVAQRIMTRRRSVRNQQNGDSNH